MSDTPRTDVAEYESQDEPVTKLGAVDADFARQLEGELNAANVEIEEKRKDVVWLATEKAKLEERIKRLEDRIDRASKAFFADCPDEDALSKMLAILEEERGKK